MGGDLVFIVRMKEEYHCYGIEVVWISKGNKLTVEEHLKRDWVCATHFAHDISFKPHDNTERY